MLPRLLLDLLTQLIRHAPIIAFVKDLNGRYRLVSDAWLTAFHTTLDDVVGKTDHELFAAQEADEFTRNDREVMASRTPSRRFEDVPVPPEVRTFFSTKFPVFDVGGALLGVAGFAVDVTEQRLLMNELERQKRFLERTQAVTDVGGWEYDLTTRSLVWTAETFRIFGVTQSEFTPTLEGALSRFVPEHRETVRDAHLNGTPFRLEVELELPTGKRRRVRLHGIPENESQRLSGAIQDVTEERALEERLRHSSRMDAVGQLAGGVAHDFNNMLGAITAAAELLRFEVGANDALDTILSASAQAAALVRQLLQFGRKEPSRRVAIDLHAVLDESMSILRRTLDRRISVVVEKHATRTRLLGDASQLTNAFINLALNARDAMPKGGTLRFRTLDEAEGLLRLEVSDTGAGISAEVLNRIFDPFFTTKARGRGTGLGLASVDAAVRGHDGNVTVRSEVGVGTTFELRLPVRPDLPAPHPRPRDATSAGATKSNALVLLIDDEDLVRRSMQRLLNHLGFRTLDARDGASGLERFTTAEEKPAAVVLDLILPGLSARDTFVALRKLSPELPVLFCSGYAPDGLVDDLLAQPRTNLLSKPYSTDALERALEALLR